MNLIEMEAAVQGNTKEEVITNMRKGERTNG
jgi:hypothetical protein